MLMRSGPTLPFLVSAIMADCVQDVAGGNIRLLRLLPVADPEVARLPVSLAVSSAWRFFAPRLLAAHMPLLEIILVDFMPNVGFVLLLFSV